MAMSTRPSETNRPACQDDNMAESLIYDSHTLFDSLPFVVLFFVGAACMFVLPMITWPLVGGLTIVSFVAGRKLERRLMEDATAAGRQSRRSVTPGPVVSRCPRNPRDYSDIQHPVDSLGNRIGGEHMPGRGSAERMPAI